LAASQRIALGLELKAQLVTTCSGDFDATASPLLLPYLPLANHSSGQTGSFCSASVNLGAAPGSAAPKAFLRRTKFLPVQYHAAMRPLISRILHRSGGES